MKQVILDNLKNVFGWRTRRKIIVLSVDDYGNVRLASRKARENYAERKNRSCPGTD